jgi:hypothetical protein
MPPLRLAVGVVLLLLVLGSGYWLWGRLLRSPSPAPTAVPPVATATAPVSRTVTAAPAAAPAGYRLAGVAVGEPASFAVIEAPNGANVLYRVNASVPGLGRLLRIEAERIVVEGPNGQFDLWLMPAATPTAAPPRTARPAVSRTAVSPRPQSPPAGGGTAPRSVP